MARQTKDKSQLIKCEYCGEMYSSTYKRCPFCNGDGTGSWDEPREEDERDDARGGGKRLTGSGARGNAAVGTIIYGIISAALIIAAIGIVVSIVRPLFGAGRGGQADPPPSATAAGEGELPQDGDVTGEGEVQTGGESSGVTGSGPVQSVTTAAPSTGTTPTSFTINGNGDFTLSHKGETFQMKATLTPASANAAVIWSSNDPSVASISENGLVTAQSKGSTTITARVEGVGEKTCIVRCSFSSSGESTSSGSQGSASTSSSISLNNPDFTLDHKGETYQVKVLGSSGGTVTWSTSDTSVATVSDNGTVKAVGPGTCTVTATVDGKTAKCIVRCSFKES